MSINSNGFYTTTTKVTLVEGICSERLLVSIKSLIFGTSFDVIHRDLLRYDILPC